MKLLVTGATGCVGRAVVAVAQARAWQVRGLARRPPTLALPATVELVSGDVRDAAAVEAAVRGCDAVIHTAGWAHQVPGNEAERAELWSSIVDGTTVVAAASQRAGARLVVTSTVAVYGRVRPGDGQPVPETDYGRAKLAAEESARRVCARTIVIRPAVVYGAHDRGNLIKLIEAVARRRSLIVGDGTNRKSMVFSENLADRLVRAAERIQLDGAWIAADDPPPTQAEIQVTIARALGRRSPPRAPARPLRWLAGGLDVLGRLRGRGTGWRDRIDKLKLETVYPGAALDTVLDYRARVPFDRGMTIAVEWWTAQHRSPRHNRPSSGDAP